MHANPYQLASATINWLPGDIPSAQCFDDIYFSRQHGLEETRHVFLQHNQLPQRWQNISTERAFTIAETGFGTGLNFLASWQLWQQIAPDGIRLHYISVEKFPLSKLDLQRALAAWPELAPLSAQLIDHYPTLVPGLHWLQFQQGNVSLLLIFGDAIENFEALRSSNHPQWCQDNTFTVDAWFLDGFAPAKNPELWNDQLYSLIADLSDTDTTLATFTAVGKVRRGLIAQGFTMEKVKGFGHKREMLKGHYNGQRQPPVASQPSTSAITPAWYVNRTAGGLTQSSDRHVAIIGGGLAGATSALAMVQRGWRVTLIEREATLAAAASGNPQGILFTKLSPEASTLNQFTLSSYLFALRFYRQWQQLALPTSAQLDFCGVLQLAHSDKEKRLFQQLESTFKHLPDLVQFVDAVEASELSGVPLQHHAWFFPQAGWLVPPDLCHSLVQHPNISVITHYPVQALEYDQGCWHLVGDRETTPLTANAVIVANSRDALIFEQTRHLPIKTIRGQITQLPTGSTFGQLKTVLCHEGYITPAIEGLHSLGATFDLNDSDTKLRPEDHQRNLQSLSRVIPEMPAMDDTQIAQLQGRAALRCTSPDYLPLVGPVPNREPFIQDYRPLSKNAKQDIATPGNYHPNLYLNIAHGSRGLTSTPVCAEVIAAQLSGEVPPLNRFLLQALNPARFIIRDLIRNKL